MATDVLVTQGARASAGTILSQIVCNAKIEENVYNLCSILRYQECKKAQLLYFDDVIPFCTPFGWSKGWHECTL